MVTVDLPVERGLGQREAAAGLWLDQRDALYPVDDYLRDAVVSSGAVRHKIGPILDQGSEGSCVGHAGAAWVNAEPVSFKNVDKMRNHADAVRYYNLCKQKYDEWPGTDYSGTSTRALAKLFVDINFLDAGYVWADSIAKINAWLRNHGPVVFSCRWTNAMYDTDPRGFKWPGNGQVIGGHAFLLFGVTRWNTWECQNSWGYDEGIDGCFYLSVEAQQKLLSLGYWSALTAPQVTNAERKRRSS